MAESQVVSGLVAKRGELAGEVEHYRRELHRLADELGHLDATIRLFDPNYDLGTVAVSKRGSRRQWFGPGECQRLVLEALAVLRRLVAKGVVRSQALTDGTRVWERG